MRDKNIDAAKGMAIVLVVMGHVCTGIPGLVKWIYSFHMPLFFLISGYLQEGKGGGQFVPYLKKKVLTLLYPYCIFAALGTLGTSITNREILGQTIIMRIFGITTESNVMGPIWFLMVLFEAEVLDYVINRFGKMWMVPICGVIGSVLAVFSIQIPFLLHISLTAIVFLNIGRELKKRYSNNKNISSQNREGVLIASFWIINIVSMTMNKNIDMYNFQYGNIVLFWIESISGSLGFLMIVLWIGRRYSWKWIDAIGKESLIIMLVHSYVHMITCIIVDKLMSVSSASLLCNGIIDIVWGCILVVLSYIIAKIIQRFFPVLINPIWLMKKE